MMWRLLGSACSLWKLALRCYQEERGKAPAKLADTAPNYLKQLPVDPFSNRPFIYRTRETNWVLYSVGPDRKDHGGTPLVRSLSSDDPIGIGLGGVKTGQSKGDLFY